MNKQSIKSIGFWKVMLSEAALIISVILLMALKSYVILSLANMYNIEMIVQMSFKQILGFMGLISLFSYKDRNEDHYLTEKERMREAWHYIYMKTIYVLLCWLMGFAIFIIL